jgi:hypothetical protein
MSKQVEVPAGIQRFGWVLGADGEHGGIDPKPDGSFIRVSDLEALYKHFSDRLLSKSVIEAGSDAVAASGEYDEDRRFEAGMQAALQATSTPEVDRG